MADTSFNRENILKLAAHAEALLFSEGAALSHRKLASLLEIDEKELPSVLDALENRLHGGITLVRSGSEIALAVAPIAAEQVQRVKARELDRDIGDAGLEVLAIVLYRGPSTRSEIDYIRGVNTSSTIRTLLLRGLLERAGNPNDGREYVYRPTVELLTHLGVRTIGELPDYATIRDELATFEATQGSRDHGTNVTNNTA